MCVGVAPWCGSLVAVLQCADKLMAPLVDSLRLLPQRWLQQQAGPIQVQGEFTELMAASRWWVTGSAMAAAVRTNT